MIALHLTPYSLTCILILTFLMHWCVLWFFFIWIQHLAEALLFPVTSWGHVSYYYSHNVTNSAFSPFTSIKENEGLQKLSFIASPLVTEWTKGGLWHLMPLARFCLCTLTTTQTTNF